MIFVTVGSQKFQFNRLLKKVDELIENGVIKDEVFAQIGVSDYKPKNYKHVDFTTREEFAENLDKCDLLITHAGTGVIVTALKKGKKVIAIPRLAKFNEHVDDHQIQLVKQFNELNLIEPCYDIDTIDVSLKNIEKKEYGQYQSNSGIITGIENYIREGTK